MIATAVIAFREFLEVFLFVGIFLGISKSLHLGKEREIVLATGIGITASLMITSAVFFFGDGIKTILNEETAELLEIILFILSGIFIAYVALSLHGIMQDQRNKLIKDAHKKMQTGTFDISLFFTIIFLVLREGIEIALFTASTSIFTEFTQNFIGLIMGFTASVILGIIVLIVYKGFPVKKIFKATEYLIILLGAALTQRGITNLLDHYYHFNLSRMGYLGLSFLPDKESFSGHLIKALTGIDSTFSTGKLLIMAGYIFCFYLLSRWFNEKNRLSIQKTVFKETEEK